jgi:hypothetical protein
MERKISNCNPSICNWEDLATGDFVFINKDTIRDWCECSNKATCLQIVDLLNNHKLVEALELMDCLK